MNRQSAYQTLQLVLEGCSSDEELQYEDFLEELETIAEFVDASSDTDVKDAYLHMYKSMYSAKGNLSDTIVEIQALLNTLSS